jgi:glycosyltransferase involved in cell wall biosynthesis
MYANPARILQSIRRNGLLLAFSKAFSILAVIVSSGIRKTLNQKQYRQRLDELENVISQNKTFFDVLYFSHGWHAPIFHRFQHISLQTSKMGGIALYGGNPRIDRGLFVYQKVAENLIVYDATDQDVVRHVMSALEQSRCPRLIRIQSTDLVTTTQDVDNFITKDFAVAYEYIDEISADLTGNVPERVYQRHQDLLKDERVIVAATADKLFEDALRYRSRNLLMSTNGVDVQHWRVPRGEPPQDLRSALTGKIVVGFHGTLGRWLDYDLLREIAEQELYELVLLGYEHDREFRRSGILDYPNVHFLGSKSYFELNVYVAYYDVAILPFKKNDLADAVSPVKIFEYMAARKPIVSTSIRESKKYRSCLIADTHEEFLFRMQDAINLRDDPEYLHVLDLEASENSWQRKTEELLKVAGIQ